MAVPAHDERDFAFANKYEPADQTVIGLRATLSSRRPLARLRRQTGRPDRIPANTTASEVPASVDAHRRRPRGKGLGQKPSSACATGASRASATGAA